MYRIEWYCIACPSPELCLIHTPIRVSSFGPFSIRLHDNTLDHGQCSPQLKPQCTVPYPHCPLQMEVGSIFLTPPLKLNNLVLPKMLDRWSKIFYGSLVHAYGRKWGSVHSCIQGHVVDMWLIFLRLMVMWLVHEVSLWSDHVTQTYHPADRLLNSDWRLLHSKIFGTKSVWRTPELKLIFSGVESHRLGY